MYTRSLAPEYVPYYLSGIKASIPLQKKVNLYLYFLNGWQVIEDNNEGKSLGTQLEYRPTDKLLLNWNTYFGDERSELNPNYRTRYFSDLFMIYQPTSKLSMTSCVYTGMQKHTDKSNTQWWQANLIGRYSFNENISLSGRLEYFDDPEGTVVTPLNGTDFATTGAGLCLNIKVGDNALFRLEQRSFFSGKDLFETDGNQPSSSSTLITANLTVWF
jgi:Putative beta-barrel porin-2, OmpL-like. bbp2